MNIFPEGSKLSRRLGVADSLLVTKNLMRPCRGEVSWLSYFYFMVVVVAETDECLICNFDNEEGHVNTRLTTLFKDYREKTSFERRKKPTS